MLKDLIIVLSLTAIVLVPQLLQLLITDEK